MTTPNIYDNKYKIMNQNIYALNRYNADISLDVPTLDRYNPSIVQSPPESNFNYRNFYYNQSTLNRYHRSASNRNGSFYAGIANYTKLGPKQKDNEEKKSWWSFGRKK